MRIVTNSHMTGFRVKRLESSSPAVAPWVNLYLKDGNEETDSLIELTSVAECDELIKAAVEAKRLLSPPAPEPVTMLVLADDDPVAAMLAAGHTLGWETGTVQGAYVLVLHTPGGQIADVGYGQTPDAALQNLRGHLAEPQECRS